MRFHPFLFTFLLTAFSVAGMGQNHAPEIRNLKAEADTVNGQIFITYELVDPDSPTVEVLLRASNNRGMSWSLYTDEVSGDIGGQVQPGKKKMIIWYYRKKVGDPLNYEIKLIADDGYQSDFGKLVSKVSEDKLEEDVSTLEGTRHYLHGAAGLGIAKELLHQRFFDLDFDANKQSFMLGSYEGHNITGRTPGQTDEQQTIMVVAHYDTHKNSPGAGDNASGVAVMLEAARVLAGQNFRKNITFVGADLQKQGGIGINRFLQRISDAEASKTQAVYILDNVGMFSDKSNSQQLTDQQQNAFPELSQDLKGNSWRGDFLFAIADPPSIPAQKTFIEMAGLYAPSLRVADVETDGNGNTDYLFANQTQQPFWNRGIPTVLITDGAETRNKNYETNKDLAKHLNYPAAGNVAKALVASIAHEAEWIHGAVETTTVSLKKEVRIPQPVIEGLVDFHLYLTDHDDMLKVRITHPTHGRLKLKLMDTQEEVFYESKIDLYYESVININISYLDAGVYVVNLKGEHFDELKEFILQ